jgi:hypothetical protein
MQKPASIKIGICQASCLLDVRSLHRRRRQPQELVSQSRPKREIQGYLKINHHGFVFCSTQSKTNEMQGMFGPDAVKLEQGKHKGMLSQNVDIRFIQAIFHPPQTVKNSCLAQWWGSFLPSTHLRTELMIDEYLKALHFQH